MGPRRLATSANSIRPPKIYKTALSAAMVEEVHPNSLARNKISSRHNVRLTRQFFRTSASVSGAGTQWARFSDRQRGRAMPGFNRQTACACQFTPLKPAGCYVPLRTTDLLDAGGIFRRAHASAGDGGEQPLGRLGHRQQRPGELPALSPSKAYSLPLGMNRRRLSTTYPRRRLSAPCLWRFVSVPCRLHSGNRCAGHRRDPVITSAVPGMAPYSATRSTSARCLRQRFRCDSPNRAIGAATPLHRDADVRVWLLLPPCADALEVTCLRL